MSELKKKPTGELKKKTAHQSLVVSIGDAALLLDVSKKTVCRMIAARELQYVIVGRLKKITMKEIERYLEESTTPVRKAS